MSYAMQEVDTAAHVLGIAAAGHGYHNIRVCTRKSIKPVTFDLTYYVRLEPLPELEREPDADYLADNELGLTEPI